MKTTLRPLPGDPPSSTNWGVHQGAEPEGSYHAGFIVGAATKRWLTAQFRETCRSLMLCNVLGGGATSDQVVLKCSGKWLRNPQRPRDGLRASAHLPSADGWRLNKTILPLFSPPAPPCWPLTCWVSRRQKVWRRQEGRDLRAASCLHRFTWAEPGRQTSSWKHVDLWWLQFPTTTRVRH